MHQNVLRLASLENGIGNLTEKVLSSDKKYVFSWGEKHCPPPNYWVIGPQHRFRCKTTMLSTKSPDHHVKSGVSGPPAVAVHGVAPAAAAEVIFKGLSFNNVGPIVGAVQGVSILRY